jgi:hypothetical protein
MTRLYCSSSATTSVETAKLESLAKFLGVETSPVALIEGEISRLPDRGVLALTADELRSDSPLIPSLAKAVADRCFTLFVTGWTQAPEHRKAIQQLTHGKVNGVESNSAAPLRSIPSSSRSYTQQLAGSQYFNPSSTEQPGFVIRHSSTDVDSLIERDGKPLFAALRMGKGIIFLNCANGIADLSEPVSSDQALTLDRLLPALIFLRSAFSRNIWTGKIQTSRLIIDDPTLDSRYGELDFERLFASMNSIGYKSTIAFIPWNYWRTSASSARWFQERRDQISVCIHGCDHTGGEFGTNNEQLLTHMCQLSLRRMNEQQQRRGLPFEKIMVFPQGKFSKTAPKSLRRTGYLAAINSTILPVDRDHQFNVGDLLLPVETRLHGFPIFRRHYPVNEIDFALDLFLGRPAFIVEHHGFFKDGWAKLERIAQCMRKYSPDIQWLSLEDAVRKTCWERIDGNRIHRVQFFTDSFEFENISNEDRRFRFLRPEPDADFVQSILVNGISVLFERSSEGLLFDLTLEPKQKVHIALRLPVATSTTYSFPPSHHVRVATRRLLSEVRDRVLTRHPALLRFAKGAVASLK